MAESTSWMPSHPMTALARRRAHALENVPRLQTCWVAGQVVGAVAAAATSLTLSQPEVALAMSLGLGASTVNPTRLWAAPMVVAGVVMASLPFIWLGLPAVIGAGAGAGAAATLLVAHRTDALDVVNGSLATLAGACIGLWTATTLLPATLPPLLTAALTAGIVGLMASQGLLPSAIRFDRTPALPSRGQIRRTLRARYRPAIFRVLDLYNTSRPHLPDRETRHGLAEVSTWVWRLQVTLQTLDVELSGIDIEDIAGRIATCENDKNEDLFTRERRRATAQHLRRLLGHRDAIATERGRTTALVEYATAFLEEARAGLAIARTLPGERTPSRLNEVLERLRSHADAGDARRRTAREIDGLQG